MRQPIKASFACLLKSRVVAFHPQPVCNATSHSRPKNADDNCFLLSTACARSFGSPADSHHGPIFYPCCCHASRCVRRDAAGSSPSMIALDPFLDLVKPHNSLAGRSRPVQKAPATISPLFSSTPMCSLRQVRLLLAP